MADRYTWIPWEKIVDNETGASLQTGHWRPGPPWMWANSFGYRPYAEAEPFEVSQKTVGSNWKYVEEGRGVYGFLIPKDIIEWQLKNATKETSNQRDTVYSYSYIVLLISVLLRFLRPRKPIYNTTYLLCETNAERYNKVGEDGLSTTIDELVNDGRIKIIFRL